LAYPLVVCLCAINLLTKEGLLLDHAAEDAARHEDEGCIYIYKPVAEAEQDVLLVAGSCQRAFLGVIVWP